MREFNKSVWEETLASCRNGWYVDASGVRHPIENDHAIFGRTKSYKTEFEICLNARNESTRVEVVDEDCIIATKRLIDEGFTPAMLNMANADHPGGSVSRGANAQEENIFRRTNLCLSLFPISKLSKEYDMPIERRGYPMKSGCGGNYSGGITVFRSEARNNYQYLSEPFKIDVISVAARCITRYNRKISIVNGHLSEEAAEKNRSRIRTIFRIGLDNGHDSLVLSAFGCGAYHNPPTDMARLFHEVMEEPEFKNRYRRIVFAIINANDNAPNENYIAFKTEFQ